MEYYTITNEGNHRYRSDTYSDYEAFLDCVFGVKNIDEIKEELIKFSTEKKKKGSLEKAKIIKSAVNSCPRFIEQGLKDGYVCVVCIV